MFWEQVPVLDVKTLEKELERSVRLTEARIKTAELRIHGKNCELCGAIESMCGAGENVDMMSDEVCGMARDDLLEQYQSSRPSNTYRGVQKTPAAVKPSGIQLKFKKCIKLNFSAKQSEQKSRNQTLNISNCSAEKSTNPEVPEKFHNCIALHNLNLKTDEPSDNSSIIDTKTLTKQPGSQSRQGGVVGGEEWMVLDNEKTPNSGGKPE